MPLCCVVVKWSYGLDTCVDGIVSFFEAETARRRVRAQQHHRPLVFHLEESLDRLLIAEFLQHVKRRRSSRTAATAADQLGGAVANRQKLGGDISNDSQLSVPTVLVLRQVLCARGLWTVLMRALRTCIVDEYPLRWLLYNPFARGTASYGNLLELRSSSFVICVKNNGLTMSSACSHPGSVRTGLRAPPTE